MTRTEVQWRCRRSILELDVLMTHFFNHYYDQLSEAHKLQFAELLQYEDQEVMSLLFYQPKEGALFDLLRQQIKA